MLIFACVHELCTASMLPFCVLHDQSVDHLTGLLPILQFSARGVVTDMQWFVVMGLEVVHTGDAAVNAVDAHGVHFVTHMWVRSLQFDRLARKLCFLARLQESRAARLRQREFDM